MVKIPLPRFTVFTGGTLNLTSNIYKISIRAVKWPVKLYKKTDLI